MGPGGGHFIYDATLYRLGYTLLCRICVRSLSHTPNSGRRSICSMNDSRPSTPTPPSSSQGRNLQVHAPDGATTSVDASSRSSTIVDQGEPTEGDGEDVNSTFAREAYGPPDGEKPQDPFEVTIGPDDPQNPKTWSRPYRWYLTMLAAVLLLNAYVVS